MKTLELTEDLLTGFPDIDDQHANLFNWGNRLLGLGGPLPGASDFVEGLRFLSGYVSFHFAAEEGAMTRLGYPGLEVHKARHAHFRREIVALIQQVQEEGISHAVKLKLHFLFSDWFTYHIRHMDRQLAAFLRDAPDPGLDTPDLFELVDFSVEQLRRWAVPPKKG